MRVSKQWLEYGTHWLCNALRSHIPCQGYIEPAVAALGATKWQLALQVNSWCLKLAVGAALWMVQVQILVHI